MVELYWYLFVFILTIFFAIFPHCIRNTALFFCFWLLIAFLTSIVVRTSGYDSDIADYAIIMQESNWSPLYLREPVLWFLLKLLYSFLESAFLVFVVVDLITFIILYVGLTTIVKIFISSQKEVDRVICNVRYIYFGLFLFYPYLWGIQIVYRQYIATILFLFAIGSLADRKYVKSFFVYMIAILTHNSIVLFSSIIMYSFKIKKLQYLSILFLLLVPVILYMSLNYNNELHIKKSNVEIGQTIEFYYMAIFFTALSLIYFVSKYRAICVNKIFLVYVVQLSYLFVCIVYFLSSGAAERFSMIILAIMYPLFAVFIELYFREKVFTRIFFVLFTLLPTAVYYKIPMAVGNY